MQPAPSSPYQPIPEPRASLIARRLVQWYEAHQRALPWRMTKEPYRIWISEIMAQQTRITALLPYYERFIERFPRLQDLAEAAADEVLKAWEGLGYYARAHNLKKTAEIIAQDHGGVFPHTERELRALPGIGPYTAGAILSICYGQTAPAIDGNVLRVMARVEANTQDIGRNADKVRQNLTPVLRDIMPAAQASAFSQSLMELGALVCLPKNPLCGQCPLQNLCLAYEQGLQQQLPIRSIEKEKAQAHKTIFVIVDKQGQVLARRRTERLLNGLWYLYDVDETLSAPEAEAHLRLLGLDCLDCQPLGPARHVFTHIVWHMDGFLLRVEQSPPLDGFMWAKPGELAEKAFPTALKHYTAVLKGLIKPE